MRSGRVSEVESLSPSFLWQLGGPDLDLDAFGAVLDEEQLLAAFRL